MVRMTLMDMLSANKLVKLLDQLCYLTSIEGLEQDLIEKKEHSH